MMGVARGPDYYRDWAGPIPYEEARYPLPGGGRGHYSGTLFYDHDGDLGKKRKWLIAISTVQDQGANELGKVWRNGELLTAARRGEVIILPLGEAHAFAHMILRLRTRQQSYGYPQLADKRTPKATVAAKLGLFRRRR